MLDSSLPTVTKDKTQGQTVNDGVFFTINCWSYKENFEFYRDSEAFTAYSLVESDSAKTDGDWKEKTLKVWTHKLF